MGNSIVATRMQRRREELGLTLDDIALEIGVARSTIQRYEKGTIEKLKLPVIEAIANVLKVDPAWLVGKTDDPHIGADNLPAPAPIALSPDESQLLEDYRGLTPPGQEYIRQTMAMAVRTYSAGDGALPQLEAE